jgi:hypothetical protein
LSVAQFLVLRRLGEEPELDIGVLEQSGTWRGIDAYAYADVGYYGLTHSLLAWARSHLWAADNAVPMIAPSWLRLRGRLGPWLRRETDKRQYQRLFQFPDYVTGVRRLALLATRKRVAADVVAGRAPDPALRGRIVEFSNRVGGNTQAYFGQLVGRQADVLAALRRMTRPHLLPPLPTAPAIAVHVRLGDFASVSSQQELRAGSTNSRLPLQWYVDMVSGLHRKLGTVPTLVYSDGSAAELQPLLRLPGVQWVCPKTAITDLLALSQSALLVSSGSGYSLWGAYLGAVPRICFPGQRITRALVEFGALDREPECESAELLADRFLSLISERLSAAGESPAQ